MKRKNKKTKKPAAKKMPARKPRINKTARTIAAIVEVKQPPLPIMGDEQNGKGTHAPDCKLCGVVPPAGQYLWLVKKNDVWRESCHVIAETSAEAIRILDWDPTRILFAMIAKMPAIRFKAERAKERALKKVVKGQSVLDRIVGTSPMATDSAARIQKEIPMKAQKKNSKKTTAKNNTQARKVETKPSNGAEKVTIKSLVISLFKKNVEDAAMVKAVKKAFPKSKFNDYHVKWYGQHLRREGLIK